MAKAGITLAEADAIEHVARRLGIPLSRASALLVKWRADSAQLVFAELDPIYTRGRRAMPEGGSIGHHPGTIDPVRWIDRGELDRLIAAFGAAASPPLAKPSATAPERAPRLLQQMIDSILLRRFSNRVPPNVTPAIAFAVVRTAWDDECKARGVRLGMSKSSVSRRLRKLQGRTP